MSKKKPNILKCSECAFVAKNKGGLTNHMNKHAVLSPEALETVHKSMKRPKGKKAAAKAPKKTKITKRNAKGQIVKSDGGKNDINKNGKAGAPRMLDDSSVRADFLTAVALGANIEACCAYAKVSRQTYYNYVEANPDFLDTIEQKKHTPYLAAIQSVVKGMTDNPNLAIKYLERKHKDEFSTRRELTGADGDKLFERTSDDDLEQFVKGGAGSTSAS